MPINPTERTEIRCGDCGAHEGQLHDIGCGMERCPFCGGQLIGCDCIYEKLELFDEEKYSIETWHLPPEIYNEGVGGKLWDKWVEILNNRGRYPFIRFPILCALCGDHYPDLFMVPDEDWRRFIQPDKQHAVICRPCFNYIKKASSSDNPETKPEIRFTDWLFSHLNDNTLTGELARFAVNDSDWPIDSGDITPYLVRIEAMTESADMLIALEDSWELYSSPDVPVNIVT